MLDMNTFIQLEVDKNCLINWIEFSKWFIDNFTALHKFIMSLSRNSK